jgi:hypothetical protein
VCHSQIGDVQGDRLRRRRQADKPARLTPCVEGLPVTRISQEFLEAERKAMPAAWFAQEYMCEFSDAQGQVFSYDDVMGALTDSVAPLFALPAEVTDSDVQPLFQIAERTL